jgi:hypothetical protein
LQVVPLWPITLKSQLNASTRKLAFNLRRAVNRGGGNRHQGYSPAPHEPSRAPSYGNLRWGHPPQRPVLAAQNLREARRRGLNSPHSPLSSAISKWAKGPKKTTKSE